MITPENYIFIIPALIILCIVFSRYVSKFGLPILVLFIAAGVWLGVDGPGGIAFDNADSASRIGNLALCVILFSGGFSTEWRHIRPVLAPGMILATVGAMITMGLVTGILALLGAPWQHGLLLGAILSATDAASVFAILRSSGLNLKYNLGQLIELESSANDPTAYMLTVTVVGLLSASAGGQTHFFLSLLTQLSLGIGLGFVFGLISTWVVNHIHSDSEGLYPVVLLSLLAMMFYSIEGFGGNAMLGVYTAGVVMGNRSLANKSTLLKFLDGQTWLMQVLLFVTLGLLVVPHELPNVLVHGLAVSALLMFVLRPLVVMPIMSAFKYPLKGQLFVSWVGLRGASSIVFAIYPLAAKLPAAQDIFNVVFIVALVTVLMQGTTLALAVKKLDLAEDNKAGKYLEIFSSYMGELMSEIHETTLSGGSPYVGRPLSDMAFPADARVTAVVRGESALMPYGGLVLEKGDVLMINTRRYQSLNEIKKRCGLV